VAAFELTPKGYVARFADAMDARIAVGNESSRWRSSSRRRVRHQGTAWLFCSTSGSRGRSPSGSDHSLPVRDAAAAAAAAATSGFRARVVDHRADWAFTLVAACPSWRT